jgi:hypothetical protein
MLSARISRSSSHTIRRNLENVILAGSDEFRRAQLVDGFQFILLAALSDGIHAVAPLPSRVPFLLTSALSHMTMQTISLAACAGMVTTEERLVKPIGVRQVDIRTPRLEPRGGLSLCVEVNCCGRERTAGHARHISGGANFPLLQNHDLVACRAIIASIALPQSLLNS